jgi:hypothetical protein
VTVLRVVTRSTHQNASISQYSLVQREMRDDYQKAVQCCHSGNKSNQKKEGKKERKLKRNNINRGEKMERINYLFKCRSYCPIGATDGKSRRNWRQNDTVLNGLKIIKNNIQPNSLLLHPFFLSISFFLKHSIEPYPPENS